MEQARRCGDGFCSLTRLSAQSRAHRHRRTMTAYHSPGSLLRSKQSDGQDEDRGYIFQHVPPGPGSPGGSSYYVHAVVYPTDPDLLLVSPGARSLLEKVVMLVVVPI